jgi:hypothetical protein
MDSRWFHRSFQRHAGIHKIEQQAWHNYGPNAEDQFGNSFVDLTCRSSPEW